jgi:ribosome-associated translation inhibitor RaiA
LDPTDLSIKISTTGAVPDHAKRRAESKIGQVVGQVREPVLFAEVRLIQGSGDEERPAIAEATLDLNGAPVRAHVAAIDIDAAIDLLEDRLKRRLTRNEDRRHHEGKERHRPNGNANGVAPEWRHGDLPTQRPEWFDRPLDEREVVRHKTFGLEPMTIDESAFDLDLLAHDFYLFTELGTGVDALISYDHGGFVLQLPEGIDPGACATAAVPFELAPPAPTLTLPQARERLEDGGEQWVFFVDSDSGRGHVLYHRYDGHYGLITPAD